MALSHNLLRTFKQSQKKGHCVGFRDFLPIFKRSLKTKQKIIAWQFAIFLPLFKQSQNKESSRRNARIFAQKYFFEPNSQLFK